MAKSLNVDRKTVERRLKRMNNMHINFIPFVNFEALFCCMSAILYIETFKPSDLILKSIYNNSSIKIWNTSSMATPSIILFIYLW
ncbi:MAG: hypothetical protein BAJALOKI1v1_270014 [Promethearchaeota archaeon]|nr:MAG: hypothetical protein BAJALOKI1v1_270014 [Candidatus Lokiarchaeota archaeon]